MLCPGTQLVLRWPVPSTHYDNPNACNSLMANGGGTYMGKNASWNRNRYVLTDNNFKNQNSLAYT